MKGQARGSRPRDHTDVVIVGGGVIGLASAWRLAGAGVAVEVVDPAPGSGASGVAAGMLAPVTEARLGEEQLLRLGLASLGLWADFAREVEDAGGRPVGFRDDGTVVVAVDGDDRAVLRDVVDRQRAMGLSVRDLTAADLRDREPALAPPVRRGALAADECSVDPAALVPALEAAAVRNGAVVRRREVVRITGFDRAGDARGVTLDDGTSLAADRVVLAAGAWAATMPGLPEPLRPPVRPVKGQVMTLRQQPGDVLVHHTVRGYVRGSAIYLVPRLDGRVVCGATVEEKGWDDRVTAGGAYELLRDVLTLFPGLDEAELVGVRSGFRPGTPDDLPVLGPVPGAEGLIMATGHYRNGILLTPITADAVTAWVTAGLPPAEVAACLPSGTVPDQEAAS